MKIYLWRHSNLFSSWSMIEEPQIYRERYTRAEVAVLAPSVEEARTILSRTGKWDEEELARIEPEIISLEEPRILCSHIEF